MMAVAPKMSVSIRLSDPSPGCPPVCGAAAGSGAALAEGDGEPVAVPVGAVVGDGEGVGDGDGEGDGDGVGVSVNPADASRPLEPRATIITAATSTKMRLAINVFAICAPLSELVMQPLVLNAGNASTVNLGAPRDPDSKESLYGTGFGYCGPNKIAEGPPCHVGEGGPACWLPGFV